MGFAQIAILAFCLVVLLCAANQHGQPCRGQVNFWITLAVVCGNIITLSFGGFFDGVINFAM